MENKIEKIKLLEDEIAKKIEDTHIKSKAIIDKAVRDSDQQLKRCKKELLEYRKEKLSQVDNEIKEVLAGLDKHKEKELKELEHKVKNNLSKTTEFLDKKLNINH
jgi:phosphoenolpyruvate-protein kinase (PTS system EI component)